jgi:hypothetical protein
MKLIIMNNISSIGWKKGNNVTPSGFMRKNELLSSREMSPLRGSYCESNKNWVGRGAEK